MTALTPRPGIMKIAPYVPGKDSVDGKETDRQALVQRGRARALAQGDGGLCQGGGRAAPLSRRRLRRSCARRSAGTTASMPTRIVCGAGSDEILNLLVRAYCGPGDELLYSQYGFLMYPINALGVGATPVAAPEKDYRSRRRRAAGHGDRQDAHRLPRQPEQPDRHLRHQGRCAPPACRPAEERAAGHRRGLCRVCQPERLRIGRRAGRPGRERGDDPHLLEDLRPGRAAPRLDVRPGRHRRRDEPAAPAVQRQPRRRRSRASRRWRTSPTPMPAAPTTTSGCPGSSPS